MHEFLAERWTASLLAWSMIFPTALDTTSPPCACGPLGTRPVPRLTQDGDRVSKAQTARRKGRLARLSAAVTCGRSPL